MLWVDSIKDQFALAWPQVVSSERFCKRFLIECESGLRSQCLGAFDRAGCGVRLLNFQQTNPESEFSVLVEKLMLAMDALNPVCQKPPEAPESDKFVLNSEGARVEAADSVMQD